MWIDNERKLLIFTRGGLLYAFDLHPAWSQKGVFVSCRAAGAGGYGIVCFTGGWPFGGQSRADMGRVYPAQDRCSEERSKVDARSFTALSSSVSKAKWRNQG